MRVLAVLFGLIGDTMMRVPALRALREHRPDLELTGICDPVTAPVLAVNPLFDRVWVWDRRAPWPRQARHYARLLREQYDATLDLYFGSRTPFLVWLSGAPRRIGPARGGARLLFTDPLALPEPDHRHMVERFLEVVAPLGPRRLVHRREFPIHPAVRRRLHARLAGAGLEIAEGDVVMVVGAGDVSKRLDEDVQRELTEGLAAEGRRVLLVADQREPELTAALAGLPGVVPLPPLPLAELGALCERADLVVSPDTGPLHIALAVAGRVLGFYLSTDPTVHVARRPGHEHSYRQVCPHQPCDTRLKHLCALECRRAPTAPELLAAAQRLLAGPAWRPPELPARDPAFLDRSPSGGDGR